MGHAAMLQSVPLLLPSLPGIKNWTHKDVEDYKDLIKLLSRQLDAVWPPAEHVWQGSRLTSLPMHIRQGLSDLLPRLLEELQALTPLAKTVSEILGLAPATALLDVRTQTCVARLILESPIVSLELIQDDRESETGTQLVSHATPPFVPAFRTVS